MRGILVDLPLSPDRHGARLLELGPPMVFVYVLAAIVAGVAAAVLLWPACAWGALLVAPFVASAAVALAADIIWAVWRLA